MSAKLIGSGAAKLVWETAVDPGVVFYTPQETRFTKLSLPWCESELRQEVRTCAKITKAVGKARYSIDHLAVGLTPSQKLINGKYTVQTEKATGDLEKVMKEKGLSFTQRLDLGRQCLEGFRALHAGDYVHGDIKPENMLVYRNKDQLTVKVSDWGKAKRQDDETTTRYAGNARFAPPEFRTSHKAETYSLGLVLLRILEEAILSQSTDKEMLLKPDHTRTIFLEKDHRGFIKYIFSNSESYHYRIKWIRRLIAWFNRDKIHSSTEAKNKNQELTYNYIDELAKRILENRLCSTQVAGELTTLIKEMTQFDPAKRPTSEQSYQKLEAIMKRHKQETVPPSYFARFVTRPLTALINRSAA